MERLMPAVVLAASDARERGAVGGETVDVLLLGPALAPGTPAGVAKLVADPQLVAADAPDTREEPVGIERRGVPDHGHVVGPRAKQLESERSDRAIGRPSFPGDDQ